jgi:hypothetical protein
MKEQNFMRPLTERELMEINGGGLFGNIKKWFKKHFVHEKVDEHSFESGSSRGYTGTNFYGVGFGI